MNVPRLVRNKKHRFVQLVLVLYLYVGNSGVPSEFIWLDTLASLIFITEGEGRES